MMFSWRKRNGKKGDLNVHYYNVDIYAIKGDSVKQLRVNLNINNIMRYRVDN